MCFAPQWRALFRHLNCQEWSDNGVLCTFSLRNVLRATTACNFSSLIWPAGSAPRRFSEPTFRPPPEPQITLPSSDPHHYIYRFVTGKSSGILSDISSGILSGISLWHIYLAYHSGILFGISHGILSGISSGIPSDILSGIASGILSGISHGILSGKSFGILSGISCGSLSGIFYLAFYLAYLLAFYLAYLLAFYLVYLSGISIWHIHLAFYLAYLLAFYLPVEVQQCTLSWGGPRLRSSGAHCAGQIPG